MSINTNAGVNIGLGPIWSNLKKITNIKMPIFFFFILMDQIIISKTFTVYKILSTLLLS